MATLTKRQHLNEARRFLLKSQEYLTQATEDGWQLNDDQIEALVAEAHANREWAMHHLLAATDGYAEERESLH